MDFTKIFQLKGLKPKNKDHMKFYECCDLMKKLYLVLVCIQALESFICVLFTGNDNNYKKNFSVEMFV